MQCAFWFDVILVSESLPAFREDDFVDKEENDHRHAAVQNGRAEVIDEVRHQQPGYGNPHAVDGVDNAGNDAERQHIPRDLLAQIALAAEHKIALDREVDALANDHGDHVGAEVRQTTVGGIVAEDVPLEGFAKQGHIHAGPAEIHHRQTAERSGQKLQQQILEHGNQIRHDDEQTALAHPLGCGRVFLRKIIPKLHNATSIKRRADAFPSAHSAPHS